VIYAAELPHVRALRIEPRAFSISMTRLDVSELSARLPALELLVVGASDLELGQLDLPKLRTLAVHSGGLSRRNFTEVCSARVPALEDLEVWFGSADYGGHKFSPSALAPLLSKRQPKLRRLGLMNAEFMNAMIDPLARSMLLPQLTELDLSMGTMTDMGAARMIANVAAFAHLAKLDVSDNAIGQAGCTGLRTTLPNVVIGEQKSARRVTVAE